MKQTSADRAGDAAGRAGRKRILVVDDDSGVRGGLRTFLETAGFDVAEAATQEAAEAAFRNWGPDLAVLDYLLPDGNAVELLPRLKAIDPAAPLLILTGHGSIDLAVRAVKEGAEQFLTKPLELPALLVVIERLLANQRSHRHEAAVRSRQERQEIDPFLGESAAVRRLREEADKIVAAERPILIQGETGAGKGVLAAWLHRHGPRADEAFVDLNCAGLSRDLLETELFGHEKGAFTGAAAAKVGLLEVANRGTVFLDEIGDMDGDVQPKLLKVIEERRFRRLGDTRDRAIDIHLIAASHQDLAGLVRDGRFRRDLYFRICAIPLYVPALRERVEDIPPLAERILASLARDLGRRALALSEGALAALQRYAWPGNLRELRNVLERAALLCEGPRLEPGDLRFETALAAGTDVPDSRLTLLELEKRHIARVLDEEGGRVEEAARRLGVPRSSLYQKLKRYGIRASRV